MSRMQRAAAVGAAEQGSSAVLVSVAPDTLPVPIASIAIRVCPKLPTTIEERTV
jgi:hypothetical protein